jgi:hypothetical protein
LNPLTQPSVRTLVVLVYGTRWVLGQRLLRQRDKAGGVVVHNLSDLLATFMYAIVVGELLFQPTRRGIQSGFSIRIFRFHLQSLLRDLRGRAILGGLHPGDMTRLTDC